MNWPVGPAPLVVHEGLPLESAVTEGQDIQSLSPELGQVRLAEVVEKVASGAAVTWVPTSAQSWAISW